MMARIPLYIRPDDEREKDELIEALKLVIEEIDDPSREHPIFEKDDFSHAWVPTTARAVSLSRPCKEQVRAALARALGKEFR